MATLRVLVVDDDPEICHLLTECLGEVGYDVVTTTSAPEALNLLRQDDFHFVLLDLSLDQGKDYAGLALLPQIREIDHDIAILVLTGYPSVDSASTSINHQVSGYIVKPFDLKELRDNLERIARRKGFLIDGEDEFLQALGRAVRDLRKKHGLTLKQTARRSGLSPAMISLIERGETWASVVALYRLSVAFGVKIGTLFE